MSKINIYGSSSDKWKDALFSHVDRDVFPKCFGGNYIEDGDEKCCKSVSFKCNFRSCLHMKINHTNLCLDYLGRQNTQGVICGTERRQR